MAAARNTSTTYTGPSVHEMRTAHIFAREIMARHDDACPIFDDARILELRRFVRDPGAAREQLRDLGLADAEGQPAGAAARSRGSLTGLMIATYGTDESFLTEDEVRALREWFDAGGGRTDAEAREAAEAAHAAEAAQV